MSPRSVQVSCSNVNLTHNGSLFTENLLQSKCQKTDGLYSFLRFSMNYETLLMQSFSKGPCRQLPGKVFPEMEIF
jgi:hypothetical protein